MLDSDGSEALIKQSVGHTGASKDFQVIILVKPTETVAIGQDDLSG
jgi:hypothetical protein